MELAVLTCIKCNRNEGGRLCLFAAIALFPQTAAFLYIVCLHPGIKMRTRKALGNPNKTLGGKPAMG